MITFFTTAKDFTGPSGIAQRNAILSWKNAAPLSEVILFGSCAGSDAFRDHPGIILCPEVKTSGEGTPRIDDMFMKAQEISSKPICCFINADIIITRRFVQALTGIHRLAGDGYLVAGQRDDVQVNEVLDFDNGSWETRIEDLVRSSGRRHAPAGSDFFAFPRGQYRSGQMPELLVGRAGWDLWMIYHGRKNGFKVIDLSREVAVIHQDHDYSHRKNGFISYDHDPEASFNLRNVPMGETFPYTLLACNYRYRNGKIRRSLSRGNIRRFVSFELHLLKDRLLFKQLRAVLKTVKLVR